MKITKIISVFTILSIFCGLLTITSFADDKVSITYGNTNVELTMIDPLDDTFVVNGFADMGNATFGNGKMVIYSGMNMFDAYGIKTNAIASADWTDMKYIVFYVENTSDGDIYFCYQPTSPEINGNCFISGALAAENPVRLVSENGKANDAKFSGTRAINARDAFTIPYKFKGYVFIPFAIIADLNNLSTPIITDTAAFTDYGFHTAPDDATYIELTIFDVYACGELPEYEEATTEKVTETQAVEETSETIEETSADEATETVEESSADEATETVEDSSVDEATETVEETSVEETTVIEETSSSEVDESTTATESNSDTEGKTDDATTSTGCKSVIGAGAILSALAVGTALIISKKRII